LRANPEPAREPGDLEDFDEKTLATLVLCIATTNLFNRIDAAIRQPAGAWG
jgi:hypothetical protein